MSTSSDSDFPLSTSLRCSAHSRVSSGTTSPSLTKPTPFAAGRPLQRNTSSSSLTRSATTAGFGRRQSTGGASATSSGSTSPTLSRKSAPLTVSTSRPHRRPSSIQLSPETNRSPPLPTKSPARYNAAGSTSLRGLSPTLPSGSFFGRGIGALPSPPNTSSDGSNSIGKSHRRRKSSEGEAEADADADFPPPVPFSPASEGERSHTPIKKSFSIPAIQRSSPTVAGSPAQAERKRDSMSSMESKLKEEGSTSESDAPTLRDDGTHHESERKDEEAARKERRDKRARELKEKNQRILDSINSGAVGAPASPPSSSHGSSTSSPRRSRPSSVRRTSTALLLPQLQATSTSLISSFSASSASTTSPSRRSRPSLTHRPSTDEFDVITDTNVGSKESRRRSATLSRLDRDKERERRVRTIGAGASPTIAQEREAHPERAMSVLGDYRPPERRADGSKWFDERRDRPSTSMGDSTDRDKRSMRRLSLGSRDGGSARRVSEPLDRANSGYGTSGSRGIRPPLPFEFLAGAPAGDEPKADNEMERQSSHAKKRENRRASMGSGGSGGSGGVLGYRSAEPASDNERVLEKRKSANRLRALSTLSGEGREKAPGDVFTNGSSTTLVSPSHRQSTQTPPGSASSQGSRFADLQARKERLRDSSLASEDFLAEVQELRQRTMRSRQSGSSGSQSQRVASPSPQALLDRDKTLRAINAVLEGNGFVAQPINNGPGSNGSPTPPPSSAIGRSTFDLDTLSRYRNSSLNEGASRSATPLSSALARSGSSSGNYSTSGRESSRSLHFSSPLLNGGSGGEHHNLLQQAYERFDLYFAPTDAQDSLAPESADLVKRVTAMVQSTMKLNSGLRGLATATIEAQIEAQLDEGRRSSSTGLGFGQFEKSVNALLRNSDDQVRSLTETLIAFTKVEREREKLSRDGMEIGTRPVSRMSVRGGPLHTSPKRPATSSPFEGAAVSMSAIRPTVDRQLSLRDPMKEPSPDIPPRRTTQSFSVRSPRSPFAGYDSPTPASGSRRDVVATRSPLASFVESQYERPSSRVGALGSSGLPSADNSTSPSVSRRSRSSATSNVTVRATTPSSAGHPSSIRFPRSPSSNAVVDQTPAVSNTSPTQNTSFSRSAQRSYSAADMTSEFDALGIHLNQPSPERDAWRNHTISAGSSLARRQQSENSGLSTPEGGRPSRQRLSTGSMGGGVGAALRTGFSLIRNRRNTLEGSESLNGEEGPDHSRRGSSEAPSSSRGSASPEERRIERRREVEQILARASGRGSMG